MTVLALVHNRSEKQPKPIRQADRYHSVEFSVNGFYFIYQFKLWATRQSSLGIIVREDSWILPWLNPGERLNGKYYSASSVYPIEMGTQIQDINKIAQGPFKGHYLVSLEIL